MYLFWTVMITLIKATPIYVSLPSQNESKCDMGVLPCRVNTTAATTFADSLGWLKEQGGEYVCACVWQRVGVGLFCTVNEVENLKHLTALDEAIIWCFVPSIGLYSRIETQLTYSVIISCSSQARSYCKHNLHSLISVNPVVILLDCFDSSAQSPAQLGLTCSIRLYARSLWCFSWQPRTSWVRSVVSL